MKEYSRVPLGAYTLLGCRYQRTLYKDTKGQLYLFVAFSGDRGVGMDPYQKWYKVDGHIEYEDKEPIFFCKPPLTRESEVSERDIPKGLIHVCG